MVKSVQCQRRRSLKNCNTMPVNADNFSDRSNAVRRDITPTQTESRIRRVTGRLMRLPGGNIIRGCESLHGLPTRGVPMAPCHWNLNTEHSGCRFLLTQVLCGARLRSSPPGRLRPKSLPHNKLQRINKYQHFVPQALANGKYGGTIKE
jgi:hypothetical protein